MKNIGSRLGGAALALTVALLGTVAIATPASASTGSAPAASDEACWLNADTGALRCYDDEEAFGEAIEARGITLDDSLKASSTAKSTTSGTATAAAAAATYYTLARFYADTGYTGAVTIITTTRSAMCDGYSYTGNLSGSWNDRVSSFKAYDGCRARLYTNEYQDGTFFAAATSASSLGSMNDKASSYKILD